MNRTRTLLLCAALLAGQFAAPHAGAVATGKVFLNAATWVDLGAGPLIMAPSGNVVFAIDDATPTIPLKQGFALVKNQTLNTTSHVWAMATDTYSASVFVSPIVGKGGGTSLWSPADAATNSMTLSNGGLTVVGTQAANWETIRNTVSKSSGKLYVELASSSGGDCGYSQYGLASASFNPTNVLGSSNYSGGIWPIAGGTNSTSTGFGNNYNVGSGGTASGDIMTLAIDFAAGKVWIGRNNVWLSGSSPAAGTLPILSFTPATVGPLFIGLSLFNVNSCIWTLKAGTSSLTYSPPSGFKAWDAP